MTALLSLLLAPAVCGAETPKPCFTIVVDSTMGDKDGSRGEQHHFEERFRPATVGDTIGFYTGPGDCAIAALRPGDSRRFFLQELHGVYRGWQGTVSATARIDQIDHFRDMNVVVRRKAQGATIEFLASSPLPSDRDEDLIGVCAAQSFEPRPPVFNLTEDDLKQFATLRKSISLTMPLGVNDCVGKATAVLSVTGISQRVKAVPNVPATVERGALLTLDGSKSEGNITDYKWTFKPAALSTGESPDPNAAKHGSTASVVLLDSMNVTLTVSDGTQTDSKTVSVSVVPRKDFRTEFTHVSEEGTLPDSDPPICRYTGRNAKGEKEYAGSWTGGENVCAIDPPASETEPVHIFHPNPDKAGKDDLFMLAQVDDEGGPWNGFYYFKEWKVTVKRETLLNKYILENGPPVFPGMSKNFYHANIDLGNDVAGYLAAVRNHEKQHSDLMQQALSQNDPAKDTEKAFGKDETKLREDANSRIRSAAARVNDRTKDPLFPENWHGTLAVPQDDTYELRSFELHVGGCYTMDFVAAGSTDCVK